MKRVYIKSRKRRKDEFQFFMHQFVEACIKDGFESKRDIMPSFKWHIRSLCLRILFPIYKLTKRCAPSLLRRDKALIVTANGGILRENIFPYFWGYEIIPMFWDCWPWNIPNLERDVSDFDCKTVMVTSSQVAKYVHDKLGLQTLWVPEGIDSTQYDKGKALCERENDVLEMGRQLKPFHDILLELHSSHAIMGFRCSNLLSDGRLSAQNLAITTDELHKMLPTYKILPCFPQCDTNPNRAGNIETLTQRYWEGMLCRCLIVGRAPQELIDLIGYNPAIEVDWSNPKAQILSIIGNIQQYQELVDKNYDVAIKLASWQSRLPKIKEFLTNNNYQI